MPTDEEILSAFGSTSKSPSDDDILAAFGTPVKKKENAKQSQELYGDDSEILAPSPLQPSKKSGEDKSFTERVATNNLPQTFAKQQTKQKSDAEILAEKKSTIPTAQ